MFQKGCTQSGLSQLSTAFARWFDLGSGLWLMAAIKPKHTTPAPEPIASPENTEIRALQSGDDRAWKKIYRDYHKQIHRHVTFMTHQAALAEDISQEVFVQAMKSIKSFEGRASLSTWLFTIANRLVYKHWRSSGRQERAYEKLKHVDAQPSSTDPAKKHLSTQRADALKAALTHLPDTLREAFILVDIQQVPSEQAAERLGITKGNLSVRASRARVKIRQELEKAGWLDRPAGASKEQPS